LLVTACGGGAGSTTSSPTALSGSTATTGPAPPDQLAGFTRLEVRVGGEAWQVAVADTPALRSRGLMGVTDLGDVRGMLFLWEDDTSGGFWMRDTLIPLDIAFFDAAGVLVDLLSMTPCREDPCPTYRPSGPYRAALEAPAGGFDGLDIVGLTLP
jgi:uncharacterized membrane protein (UPF0127 family)